MNFKIVLIGIVFILVVIFLVDYIIHLMTRKDSVYDYADFPTFLRTYNRYAYHTKTRIEGECVYVGIGAYLDPYMIKFNFNIMILYPWSYVRYRIWLHGLAKKRKKGLFK